MHSKDERKKISRCIMINRTILVIIITFLLSFGKAVPARADIAPLPKAANVLIFQGTKIKESRAQWVKNFYETLPNASCTETKDISVFNCELKDNYTFIILWCPSQELISYADRFNDFVHSGGRILFVGENSSFSAENAILTRLAEAMNARFNICNDAASGTYTTGINRDAQIIKGSGYNDQTIQQFVLSAASYIETDNPNAVPIFENNGKKYMIDIPTGNGAITACADIQLFVGTSDIIDCAKPLLYNMLECSQRSLMFAPEYNENGATGGEVPIDGNDYEVGDTAIVLDNIGGLVNGEKKFEGWNTAADGSGIFYQPGDSIVLDKKIVLYAQWAEHGHVWNYSADGPILTATCMCKEGDSGYQYCSYKEKSIDERQAALTLDVSSPNFVGSTATVTVGTDDERDKWKEFFGESSIPDVWYEDAEGNVLTASPTEVGTYFALISPVGVDANDENTARAEYEIIDPIVHVIKVSLNKSQMEMTVGETETLIATIAPENATDKRVKWSSSNSSVVKVDNRGIVTAVSKGIATITVTTVDRNKTAECEVIVKNPKGNVYSSTEDVDTQMLVTSESEDYLTFVELTESEKGEIDDGRNLVLELVVENNVSMSYDDVAKVQTAIKKAKPNNNPKIVKCLDISFYKYFEGERRSDERKIHETDAPVNIALKIPDNIYKEDKEYGIVRVHNGKTVLFGTYDKKTHVIEFATSLFSDYVIVSWDVDTPPEEVDEETIRDNELALDEGLEMEHKGRKIIITWGKVEGADGYELYAAYCGRDKVKRIKKVNSPDVTKATVTKLNGKKVDPKRNVKMFVKAYKYVNGKKISCGKSITGHVVGSKSEQYSNAKEIELFTKDKMTIKKGKSKTIKGRAILVDPSKEQLSDAHAKELRFATSNPYVAKVNSKGKVTGKKAGKCTIYVYARNGYAKKVTVIVK